MAKNYGKKSKKNRKNFKVKTNSSNHQVVKEEASDSVSLVQNSTSASSKNPNVNQNKDKAVKTSAQIGDGINNIDSIKKDLWLMAKSVAAVILIFIGCYYYLGSSAGQKLIDNIKL